MLWCALLHRLGPGRKGGGNRGRQELVLAKTPAAWGEPSPFLPTPRKAGAGQETENVAAFSAASFHLLALHSCCRLVIRYLKNSYTDHAMAVEGIW